MNNQKITEVNIIDQKDLRNQIMSNAEEKLKVLHKVKELFLIPQMNVMTITQVAEYFEVPLKTIQTCYRDNKEEISLDGVSQKSHSDFLSIENQYLEKTRGKTVIKVSDNITITIPNRGITVFPPRAILRIAMLLRDSIVAKEIRTQLLNTFEQSTAEQKTVKIDEEMGLIESLVSAFAKGDNIQMLSSAMELNNFQKRYIKQLQATNTTLKADNRLLSESILEWKDRSKINRAVRLLSTKLREPFGVTWNNLYTELLYKYGISLKKRGNKPYINHIKEHEWDYLVQSFSSICEKNGFSASEIFTQAKIQNVLINKTEGGVAQ